MKKSLNIKDGEENFEDIIRNKPSKANTGQSTKRSVVTNEFENYYKRPMKNLYKNENKRLAENVEEFATGLGTKN